MKNRFELVRYGTEKFIQTLLCMTMMSSTGRPTDLKVKSSTMTTKSAESMLMSRLSVENDERRSRAFTLSPTSTQSS